MKTRYFVNDQEVTLEELDELACGLKAGEKICLSHVFENEIYFEMELS